MMVILNLAVGGPWAGSPNSSTLFPATMSVDWIRWDPATFGLTPSVTDTGLLTIAVSPTQR